MWREFQHPRDEYGRFRLGGPTGTWDRLAGQVEARAALKLIREWDANQAEQTRLNNLFETGKITPAQEREWDRLGERATAIRDLIPRAHWKGMRPHDDGTWRHPGGDSRIAYDANGRPLPMGAAAGWVRVGDHPERVVIKRGERMPGHGGAVREFDSPLMGGVWHKPGDMLPGQLPRLVNDWGAAMTHLQPEEARSRRYRYREGALGRAEMRAEATDRRVVGGRLDRRRTEGGADVQGGFLVSPLNPVARRRSARKKRDRQQTVTWIQRLSDRMEGR